jgi:acetolactate synthase-1/2/3 large subunit
VTTRNGAQAILEILERQGTEFIFCSPIAVWAPLWEALAERHEAGVDTPRYVNCRHELLAVGLASGFYKATGRPQVVLLATGLGVLNGSMGLRTAMHERTPMTVLSPDTQTYGAVPDLDPGPEWPSLLVDLAGPARDGEIVVKWAKAVKTAADLEPDLRRALYFADQVPRGPTLLEIPFDVLMQPVALARQPRLEPHALMAPATVLRQTAELLARSENPVIVTEHAGRTDAEVATLVALAEHLGAPVFEFWNPAYHNFPRNHPLHGEGPVEAVLPRADCIVVAGCNAPWHPPQAAIRGDATVIVFEEDPLRPRAPYWGYRTDRCVAGDVAPNLDALLGQLRECHSAPRIDRAERWRSHNERLRSAAPSTAVNAASSHAVPAAALFRTLHGALPESAIIVDEIVAQLPDMLRWLFAVKPFKHYRGWAGALGTGLPTAFGVKLARPGDIVVSLIGDGAFHYNPVPACFGLAQQYRLPLLTIVMNNRGYVSQAWNLEKYFPQGAALRTHNLYGKPIEPTPDYAALVAAYDGYGERVTAVGELDAAVGRALDAVNRGRLALLDVYVEP